MLRVILFNQTGQITLVKDFRLHNLISLAQVHINDSAHELLVLSLIHLQITHQWFQEFLRVVLNLFNLQMQQHQEQVVLGKRRSIFNHLPHEVRYVVKCN